MNQEKIGKFIQERRKERKLTQMELSERLGVSNRTISKWENGNSLPDYSMFNDLCKELDISINELLSGEKLTGENYQKKLEENFMNTIDYNNKNRNKKIRKFIIFIFLLLLTYLLYKIFILYYYKDYNSEYRLNEFPNNKNIMNLKIETDITSSNTVVFDDLNIYIPKEFELVTDKSKARYVMDDCKTYIKGLTDDKSHDSVILICNTRFNNLNNLDHIGIYDSIFPYINIFHLFDKYHIEDIVDLIKYYEKHAHSNQNIFTSSDKIKMNYIAREYVQRSLVRYDHFYYLENDLKGYLIDYKNSEKNYVQQQVVVTFGNETYSIYLKNENEEYFNHENTLEIIRSIYKK